MATSASTTASTKEALLAAAREEFAEHGIAGARVDRIARLAGVNKERIYGYFGNKEKLFDAVMKDAMDELTEVNALLGDDPVQYVAGLFDHYQEHPDLLRLLMWEALHDRSGHLPDQQWRVDRCHDKVASLAAHLGQEPSAEAGRTMLSLMGLVLMPMALPQLAELMGAQMDGPESTARMREHATAFARAFLECGKTAGPS
ncbi:TetR/AcrR family transcriptional regulator [Actinomadura xylanilytica]|uniref:TetR/AcrR family transcriptional regulator n=1 Tax=Actinomadura xylanilytica TaxID=887459 RepID=UPI00255B014E|nr:TetR family transcriptional regulator [Actinomadura xylanilytica]MDL4771176.1 TetR family transcriptional regulator [Actinomadura xylanilytica]